MQYKDGLVALNNGSTVGSNYTLTAISSGSMSAGTYFYVLSVIYPAGESVKSTEKSITINGTTQKGVRITWDAVQGATRYRIYRGTSSGGQNRYFETTSTTFDDTGATGTTGTPLNSSNVAQYVVGYGTQFLTNVTPGCIFKRKGENVTYEVASVISNTLLMLNASYAGTGTTGTEYQIVRDFTDNLSLTEIWEGDVDWAYHITTGVIRKLDSYLTNTTYNVVTINNDRQLTTENVVLVNASSKNITIELPNATVFSRKSYLIKKIDTSSNTVTITVKSGTSQTIEGETTYVLNNRYQFVGLQNDGSNWIVTVHGLRPTFGQLNSSWFNRVPMVGSDGGLEIGNYIDFHTSDTETNDYSIRLTPWSNRSNLSLVSAAGYWRTVSTISGSSVTLYVDNVNGNDTTGTGSSSSPFATISRALDEVGQFYNANITIILKASAISYGTINVAGFIGRSTGSAITIQGETTTLDSGTVSSHSNSVDDPVYGSSVTVARITDTTKSWTTDQHKHKLLRVYKGATSYYRIITNNDTTNLYCSYTFPVTFDNTWSYEILDWGTRVGNVNILGCSGQVTLTTLNIESSNTTVTITDSRQVTILQSRIVASASQSSTLIQCSFSHLILNFSYIDLNNRGVTGLGLSGLYNHFVSNGAIFDRAGTAAFIYNWMPMSRVLLYSGVRFYRGTSNPTIGINMDGGILYVDQTNGKIVVDAGTTGIQLIRGAVLNGLTPLYFGSNVTTPISAHLGLINNARLMVETGLGVNITDNNYLNLHSRLQVQGSIATQVTTVSANTTLGIGQHIVLVNASGGARTITLPDATTCTGRQYIIKKIDSSANAVTIAAQSGQTIDGASSQTLSTQWQFIGVASDGSNWFRIE